MPPAPVIMSAMATRKKATARDAFISRISVEKEMARRSSTRKSRGGSRRSRRTNMKGGSRRRRTSCMRGGSRRSRRRTSCMRGGQNMGAASQLSLAQGREYAQIHSAQHGGAAVSLASSAPVGYTGVLDDSLRAIARIGPLDHSMAAIQGMSDQSGGGKKRSSRIMSGKAFTKKLKAIQKRFKKMMKRMSRRRMRGGAGAAVGPVADYGAPGMLLSPAQEAKAMMGMNPEWKLASDPTSFAPKMA